MFLKEQRRSSVTISHDVTDEIASSQIWGVIAKLGPRRIIRSAFRQVGLAGSVPHTSHISALCGREHVCDFVLKEQRASGKSPSISAIATAGASTAGARAALWKGHGKLRY